MQGEQEARVLGVKPFLLHGVTYYDVTVAHQDQSVSMPGWVRREFPKTSPGELVVAKRAANMIVTLRRPEPVEATGDG